jgi:hypothetical protein
MRRRDWPFIIFWVGALLFVGLVWWGAIGLLSLSHADAKLWVVDNLPLTTGQGYLSSAHSQSIGVVSNCFTMTNVMVLCEDPPTIWINPKLEPRDAANRVLGAFQAMGYMEQKP